MWQRGEEADPRNSKVTSVTNNNSTIQLIHSIACRRLFFAVLQ